MQEVERFVEGYVYELLLSQTFGHVNEDQILRRVPDADPEAIEPSAWAQIYADCANYLVITQSTVRACVENPFDFYDAGSMFLRARNGAIHHTFTDLCAEHAQWLTEMAVRFGGVIALKQNGWIVVQST
jgi:hypothetical protein